MEYYTLSRYVYWKYYILVLYYRLAEYPPVVRVWAVFTTICLIVLTVIILENIIRLIRRYSDLRHISRNHTRYYDSMREVALSERNLELSDISDMLKLPKNYKMKERQNRLMIPVIRDLYQEVKDVMNDVNWQRMLQVLKMPAYFEDQVLSASNRKRVAAFKHVVETSGYLKEAVASRFLFAKNRKLQMHARLHAARFGTSYPFKVLEEDPNLVFTEELVVKYHNVLVYRKENGLTMPNFIRWCNRVPVNEDLRVFAVNEIRLFKQKEDCAELLTLLQSSRDERFSCAIIRALGELNYVPAEKEFLRRYLSASYTERQELAEALGIIGSGNPEVLQFLIEDFRQTTDYVMRMKLLRVIHDYGHAGRQAFQQLKAESRQEYAMYFDHIECDLIDSRRYA